MFLLATVKAGQVNALFLTGQSNANGIAPFTTFSSTYQGTHPLIKIFYPAFANAWNSAIAGTNTAESGLMGIEVPLGKMLNTFTSKTSFIIKDVENGKGIYPTGAETSFNTGYEGNLITRGVKTLYNARRLLIQTGDTLTVKTLVIIQGESDARYQFAAFNYYNNLKAVIEKYRLELNNPQLKIVIVKLNTVIPLATYPFLERIRSAQELLKTNLNNITIVDTNGATMRPDGIHYDAPFLETIAQRIFDEIKLDY